MKQLRILLKCGGIALGVLVVIQFGTYWLFAKHRVNWTIHRFLPQQPQFAFVCVSQRTADALSDAEKNALRTHLLHRFPAAFVGEKAIPAGAKEEHVNKKTGEPVLDGLKGGCLLAMRVEERGFMWFRAQYADWEGNLAASSREATFVWILGRWWAVKHQEGAVS